MEDRDSGRTRVPPAEGARNLRDLGGYRTVEGRETRWGRLYRSGSLHGLSAAGRAYLRSLDITAICDLRTNSEREHERLPIEEFPGTSYWCRDYHASFANLRETLTSGLATFEDARAAMIAGYRTLPFDQAPALRQLFTWLAEGRLPLVFNCTAGKDRTGVASALVLASLGVPRDVIVADYLRTNEVLGTRRAPLAAPSGAGPVVPADVIAAVTTVERAYVEAALDEIDARYGTLDAYLRIEIDIEPAAMASVRARLLT